MIRKFKVNKAFKFLWTDRSRFVVLKGSAGSGKSFAVGQYCLTRVMNEKGCNAVFTRKVSNTLRVSVFALMKQLIYLYGMQDEFKINKSDMEIKHLATGNQIFFLGLDDVEKIKSITAENGNICLIWMEEASEDDQKDLDQLNARLRGLDNIFKQMILTFNPISEEHWLKAAFWDLKTYQNAVTHHSTYKDNIFLDEEYKSQLESYKHSDPYFYSVYCLGEWGSVGENDTIIPYHLAHKARYRTDVEATGVLKIGLDVARFGDDSSCAYAKRGGKVLGKRSCNGKDAKQVADMTIMLLDLHRNGKNDHVIINVDATGLGSGAVDMLNLILERRKNITINEINFGANAIDKDRYADCATEMYFNVGSMINEMQLLEHDADLIPELTKRKYTVKWKTSQTQIEPKADFKKRTHKSPDNADALVLAFYDRKCNNSRVNDFYSYLRNTR